MASTSQFSLWSLSSPLWSNFLWWHVKCLAVLMLLIASVNGEMHINKCCGAKDKLSDYLDECVPFKGAVTTTDSNTNTESFTAIESFTTTKLSTTTENSSITPSDEMVLNGGLPFWIDPDLTVLEAHSLLPLGGGAAWTGARATFGRRPCSFSDSQFVFTLRREMYQLLTNGSLVLPMWRTNGDGRGRTKELVALSPEEWCMDSALMGHFVILACPCQRVTCLNRCCNKNSMFEAQKNRHRLSATCKKVSNGTAFRKDPVFYNGIEQFNDIRNGDVLAEDDGGGVVYTELFAHSIKCDDAIYSKHLLNSHSYEITRSYWIQRNGSVIIENFNHGRAFERQHVCHVEVQTTNGGVISELFFCHKRCTTSEMKPENMFYSLLFLLGSFFLLLTLVVHALVPELRRSAHAKALMCHCASLLIASVTLAIAHIQRIASQPFCTLSAFVVQFSFLSTFFWLNVMCFDLSWTFGAMRRRRVASAGGHQTRRFLWYSLYAWGCPALVTAITLFMEFAPAHIVPPDLPLLPNIGARRCWFDSKSATFVYYYGPMALSLLVDLALFVFTVVRIKHPRSGTSSPRQANARTQGNATAKAPNDKATATTEAVPGDGGDDDATVASGEGGDNQKEPGRAENTASKKAAFNSAKSLMKSGDRQILIVYTKLFCLMVVTWVTEIVSWLADDHLTAFWYITDAVNLLRGVLIFVFFCCKPVALRPLKARLRACAQRCCPAALRLGASRKQPRASISTLESSQSMPEFMESTTSAVAPGAASANGIKEDAL